MGAWRERAAALSSRSAHPMLSATRTQKQAAKDCKRTLDTMSSSFPSDGPSDDDVDRLRQATKSDTRRRRKRRQTNALARDIAAIEGCYSGVSASALLLYSRGKMGVFDPPSIRDKIARSIKHIMPVPTMLQTQEKFVRERCQICLPSS